MHQILGQATVTVSHVLLYSQLDYCDVFPLGYQKATGNSGCGKTGCYGVHLILHNIISTANAAFATSWLLGIIQSAGCHL